MNLDDLIIAVFCQTDDAMKVCLQQLPKARLRERGSWPTLCDSEVLCMEIIGAYLGLEQDQAIYNYFVRHYSHFFAGLLKIHRTTFTRQAANLSHLKKRLWQHWLADTPHQHDFGLLDSLPLPGHPLGDCRFARATFCRRFRYEDVQQVRATYGYDHVARQTYWGLRLHWYVAWPGLITRLTLAPAHEADVAVTPQVLQEQEGIVIGDRNYHSPDLQQQLRQDEPALKLLAPFKNKRREPNPQKSKLLSSWRYRIETVNSQLCQRFPLKQLSSNSGRATCGICSTGCCASCCVIPSVFVSMSSWVTRRSNWQNWLNKLAHHVIYPWIAYHRAGCKWTESKIR